MRRPATTVVIGALVITIVVLLMFRGKSERPPATERPPPQTPSFVAQPMAIPCVTLPSALPPFAMPAPSSSRPLPAGAPKSLRFGVVLFQYRGAQMAPETARSREDALSLARGAMELARRDFKAAVKTGDPGSKEDVGRMTHGILEPAVEYELFTLTLGAISEPIDTPRGYWVAKRLE